jgi:hypothetical protein
MPITSEPIEEQRGQIRHLIDEHSPHQARLAHYSLEHPASRSHLYVSRPHEDAQPNGFLVSCVTGLNPFQPIVVFSAPDEDLANRLIRAALVPGRPYLFLTDISWAGLLESLIAGEVRFHHVLELTSPSYQPVVNVFVRMGDRVDVPPRATIEAQGRVVAQAGINWQGRQFAEIYVNLDPAAEGREWTRSVLAAVSGQMLQQARRLLYYPPASHPLTPEYLDAASKVGYRDTGRQVLEIDGMLRSA